jgi:hypothetical protein
MPTNKEEVHNVKWKESTIEEIIESEKLMIEK